MLLRGSARRASSIRASSLSSVGNSTVAGNLTHETPRQPNGSRPCEVNIGRTLPNGASCAEKSLEIPLAEMQEAGPAAITLHLRLAAERSIGAATAQRL